MTTLWVSLGWAAAFLLLYALTRPDDDKLYALLASERAAHREHTDRLMALTERALEQTNRPHPDIAELVALTDRLCQRIQAPEAAVIEHQMQMPLPPMPQVIDMDDDQAHWESKEQMAEREMTEEAQAMRSVLA